MGICLEKGYKHAILLIEFNRANEIALSFYIRSLNECVDGKEVNKDIHNLQQWTTSKYQIHQRNRHDVILSKSIHHQ
jgi:hypothetical protein